MSNTNNLVIFDVDGTLSDPFLRMKYISGEGKKNWGAFFREAKEDFLVSHVSKMYKLLHILGHDIRVVTGRPEHLREDTLAWFDLYGLPLTTEKLFMRANSDRRPDFLVKQDIFTSWNVPPQDVFCVFEDRLQVVAMWKSLGLKVFVCGGDYEDSPGYLKYHEHMERIKGYIAA